MSIESNYLNSSIGKKLFIDREPGCSDIRGNILSFLDQKSVAALRCLSKATTGKQFNQQLNKAQRQAWQIIGKLDEKNISKLVEIRDWKFINFGGYLNLDKSDLSSKKLYDCILKFPNLTILNLANAKHLTNDSLAFLQHVPHLKALDLAGCNQISTKGIDNLEFAVKLEKLGLSNLNLLNNEDLAKVLKYCKKLKLLLLNGCTGIKKQVSIQEAKNLEVLQFIGCHEITDFIFGENAISDLNLTRCTSLTNLDFLRNLKLKTLYLNSCSNIDSAKFAEIDGLRDTLEDLHLMATQVDNLSLPFITNCEKLKTLGLTNSQIHSISSIAYLTFLEELFLYGYQIKKPDDLKLFSNLKYLKDLRLNADLDSNDLKMLQGLKSLHTLGFRSETVLIYQAFDILLQVQSIRYNIGNKDTVYDRKDFPSLLKPYGPFIRKYGNQLLISTAVLMVLGGIWEYNNSSQEKDNISYLPLLSILSCAAAIFLLAVLGHSSGSQIPDEPHE